MSIRAIDSQMMITRASDFLKDASVDAKKGELSQQYSSVQAKAAAEQNQRSVGQTMEVEQAEVKLSKDSEGKGGGGGSSQKEDQEQEAGDPQLELKVGFGEERKIDITV